MEEIIEEVEWLLYDSGLSGYRISIETGISFSTVGRIRRGEQPIERLSTMNTIKLMNKAKYERRKLYPSQ